MSAVMWKHEQEAVKKVRQTVASGTKSLVVVAPTGGGKTRIMAELARWGRKQGFRAAVLVNRQLLIDQTASEFLGVGVAVDYFAAGRKESGDGVPICSVPTITRRVFNEQSRCLPDVDLVMVDEAHSNATGTARKTILEYKRRGAFVIGFTATPVGLGGLYEEMIEVGSYSTLIDAGVLASCRVFAPSEADMRGVKIAKKTGEYIQADAAKRIIQCTVFGNVFDEWSRLNPRGLPTVLFAPSIAASVRFRDEFISRGISAAHIDGTTAREERNDAIDGSRNRKITVLCSCGVFREGANLPWIAHGILLQPCRKLSTFLQIAGRLLRSHKDKRFAILQDHVGVYWRHGCPTDNRLWDGNDSDIRQDTDPRKMLRCPKCFECRSGGTSCPGCGFESDGLLRLISTVDGRLEEVVHVVESSLPSCPRCGGTSCPAGYVGAKKRLKCTKCTRSFTEVGWRPTVEHPPCPECGSASQSNGKKYGKPRWKCRQCHRNFGENPSPRKESMPPITEPCPSCGGKLKRAGKCPSGPRIGSLRCQCYECGRATVFAGVFE